MSSFVSHSRKHGLIVLDTWLNCFWTRGWILRHVVAAVDICSVLLLLFTSCRVLMRSCGWCVVMVDRMCCMMYFKSMLWLFSAVSHVSEVGNSIGVDCFVQVVLFSVVLCSDMTLKSSLRPNKTKNHFRNFFSLNNWTKQLNSRRLEVTFMSTALSE